MTNSPKKAGLTQHKISNLALNSLKQGKAPTSASNLLQGKAPTSASTLLEGRKPLQNTDQAKLYEGERASESQTLKTTKLSKTRQKPTNALNNARTLKTQNWSKRTKLLTICSPTVSQQNWKSKQHRKLRRRCPATSGHTFSALVGAKRCERFLTGQIAARLPCMLFLLSRSFGVVCVCAAVWLFCAATPSLLRGEISFCHFWSRPRVDFAWPSGFCYGGPSFVCAKYNFAASAGKSLVRKYYAIR